MPNGTKFVDYELFLKTFIEPDEVLIVNIVKNSTFESNETAVEEEELKDPLEKQRSLKIQGVNDKSEVLF